MKLTGICRWSRAALGASACGLGPLRAVLGCSWHLCWRSWAALGAFVGGPDPLLSPWAALGAYVGGPGLLLGPVLAVLGPLGTYVGGLGSLLGPMLAVLGPS